MPIYDQDYCDCSSFVTQCLIDAGYTELDGKHQLTVGNSTLEEWAEQNLTVIYNNISTGNVSDLPNIQPGDIVTLGTSLDTGHTQVFYGYNSEGNAIWISGGSSGIMQVEGQDEQKDGNIVGGTITGVYRVPGGTSNTTSTTTSTSNTAVTRTVTNNDSASTDGVNDYCVKTDEPDSMPVLNESQLLEIVEKSNVREEGKATMREVIPSIVKAQEKYKVNAVFCLAVTLQESGWGSSWDYIDKSTYNWTSWKGRNNGGYLGSDGNYWDVYDSWEDCTNHWFERIANHPDGYYFANGDYTCNSIGYVYCTDPPNWGGAVSSHIETFYGYLGITPNVVGVDAGNAVYGNSNTMQEDTGDIKIDTELDKDNNIQGGIKIQRKDEDGNTTDLKYTSTKNFNALISSNDSRALEYYTLVKSSGSDNGSTASSGGVVLQGSEVSEQMWNFFVNDMGYSEEVTAGILGNAMEEAGGQTLNIDPSAQNSIGNGHYGVFQWDMVYCSEVVGKGLAEQLEYYKTWIQGFDDFAKNYKAGFTYEEFLKLTDPQQVAIAFATVMERYEGYNDNGVWQSYAVTGSTAKYEKRMENALNAYATYAGKTSSSSSSSSGNSSSSSSKTNSSTSSTTTSGGSFVEVAARCHQYLSDNKYKYSDRDGDGQSEGRAMPVVEGESEKWIDCASYVTYALMEYGYCKDYTWQLTATSLVTYGEENLEKVYQGKATNVSQLADLQPGDIVVQTSYNNPSSGPGHTQIFYGYVNGDAVWLNCGTKESILYDVGTDVKNDFSSQPILYVFRVPGGGGSVVTSLDNFLFIGDSRYDGAVEDKLESLGDNITAIGVGSSQPANWLDATANGSGFVAQGNSSSGENVTLPDSASGVSVLLGTNALSQISEMEEVLNNLHKRYPAAPIFVNSVYHVGTAYTYADKDTFNTNVDSFNEAMRDFCNQNSWAYYVDINEDLDDGSGYLRSDYSSDGLHISSQEGIDKLISNIKDGILSTGAIVTSADTISTLMGGYQLVVANRKDVTTTVTNEYSHSHTYSVETSNGHTQTGLDQVSSTPSPQVVSSSTRTTYNKTSVDYQSALKNYTLYFDFLWGILINSSGDRDLVSSWADLAINGNVVITVYNDTSTSSGTSSIDVGLTPPHTEDASGPVVVYDVYNIKEVTATTTKTLTSKPAITEADTWLINYTNPADTYSEYKGKSKEKIKEKTDPNSKEDNIVKILQGDKTVLKELIKEEDIVDEMIEENEKVNFMIDIYSYVLQVADGKSTDQIKLSLDGLLDTSVFDLSNTEDVKITKVLLYDSLNLSEGDIQNLYKAVEKICEPFGDNDDNTKRKKFVTSVILNRTMSSQFPNSVSNVLNQSYQFENFNSSVLKDDITISDSTKEAVDTIIVAGDCAQHSVYFAKPSTAEKNKWDEQYTFTFNDGDETDNSFNYYTTDEVDAELKKYETTVNGGMTRPSLDAQKIIKWATQQVGKAEFENKHENKKMNSNNSSPEFIKSAYFEGGLEYISGDIPCPNEIEYKDDGTVDYSKIPEVAVIVADNGIASLYVGNGYVIEAGGGTIQKVPIGESQGAGHFKGWGFAVSDQDKAREDLVVSIGGGNYAQGYTPMGSDGIAGIYTIGNKSYKAYVQWGCGAPWEHEKFSESGSYSLAACGVTSVAIIATGYGNDVTPYDVGTYAYSVVGEPVGSTTTAVTSWATLGACLDHYGIKHSGFKSATKEEIIEHLKQGKPVIMNISAPVKVPIGRSAYDGHYVTLLGMDSQGRIFLGDPASGGGNTDYFAPENIFSATYSGVCFIED